MAFSWGAALKQFGQDIPTIGTAFDTMLENKRKYKRQDMLDEEQRKKDERQAILDTLTAQSEGLDLEKLRDEIVKRNEGRAELKKYNAAKKNYDDLQKQRMPEPPPGTEGPLSLREQGAINTNKLIDKIKKPDIKDYGLDYYSEYDKGIGKMIPDKNEQKFEDIQKRHDENLELREKALEQRTDYGNKRLEQGDKRLNLTGASIGKQLEKDDKLLGTIDRVLRTDPLVKQSVQKMLYADSAYELLNANMPISDEASKTMIARLSGEVGVLTDRDIMRWGGSKDLKERALQAIETAKSGKLTSQNRKYLLEVVNIMKQKALQTRNEQLQTLAEAQVSAYPDVDYNRVNKLVDKYKSSFMPKEQSSASGTIKYVRDPKTGKLVRQ